MLILLLRLLFAHGLCDYPLQGDFLARGKNHKAPIPGVPWYQCLIWHAVIHGGAVALVTGSVILGLAETIAHVVIDFGKCAGWTTFNQDQALHVACKLLWAFLCVSLPSIRS